LQKFVLVDVTTQCGLPNQILSLNPKGCHINDMLYLFVAFSFAINETSA
jgi:hypothetical protein